MIRDAREYAMTASQHGPGRRLGLAALIALVPLALVLAVGCAGKAPLVFPPQELVARPWVNLAGGVPSQDADVIAVAGLSEVLAGKPPTPQPGKPLNILVLSGGGKYGAFTAGALVGWTAAGTRPTFDVATGISSGAVVATLAFLGPKYDGIMTRHLTTLRRDELYAWQPIRGFCMGTGLMTAEPLDEILKQEVNEQFMCDLAAAHAEGRRLYVGTGNIITNRIAVWDLGAIASSGRPDAALLVRKILVASCSAPGVVVPVEMVVEVNGVKYSELHADAGNIAQAFVRTPAAIPAGSNVWILSAGKAYRDQLKERPRVIGLIGGAVSNSLYALFRSDVMKIFALCAVTKSHFKLLVLPQDFEVTTSAFAFDPNELVRLHQKGYEMVADGQDRWRTIPPDTLPHEVTPARTGLEFITP
jgi:predicted patatin/cPLA2 family phospholipase/predicted small lipoprotein YifL